MTELSFAKSFLSTLETRPSRLSADHVEDPRSYPARGAYILPKMHHAMSKRQRLAPGQERSLKVILKSLRNPPLDIVLKSQPPLTSILDLKTEVLSQVSVPLDRIRILHRKKPVGDAKVLKELVGEDDSSIEFSVMIMGGTASVKSEDRTTSVSQGSSGTDLIGTEAFWDDLKAFLIQRLRDQTEGERLYSTFRKAWDATL